MRILKEDLNRIRPHDLLPGFYEADKDGIIYRGLDYEPQLLDDIEMLNPDEFIFTYKLTRSLYVPNTWIGAWFGEDDVSLLSTMYLLSDTY